MAELLPCPFCGGEAQIRYTGNNSGFMGYTSNILMRSKPGFVMCLKCGVSTTRNSRVCVAITKWNTRTESEGGKDNTCCGCVCENIDDTTEDIAKCVCCKRNVEYAKNDYYMRKEDEKMENKQPNHPCIGCIYFKTCEDLYFKPYIEDLYFKSHVEKIVDYLTKNNVVVDVRKEDEGK
jgi:hypothetical protein